MARSGDPEGRAQPWLMLRTPAPIAAERDAKAESYAPRLWRAYDDRFTLYGATLNLPAEVDERWCSSVQWLPDPPMRAREIWTQLVHLAETAMRRGLRVDLRVPPLVAGVAQHFLTTSPPVLGSMLQVEKRQHAASQHPVDEGSITRGGRDDRHEALIAEVLLATFDSWRPGSLLELCVQQLRAQLTDKATIADMLYEAPTTIRWHPQLDPSHRGLLLPEALACRIVGTAAGKACADAAPSVAHAILRFGDERFNDQGSAFQAALENAWQLRNGSLDRAQLWEELKALDIQPMHAVIAAILLAEPHVVDPPTAKALDSASRMSHDLQGAPGKEQADARLELVNDLMDWAREARASLKTTSESEGVPE